MAHEKKCPVCDKTFWGNINKIFCGDSCRKYEKRNPNLSSLPSPKFQVSNASLPEKGGQGRTNKGGIGNYAIKKGIDVLAHKLMHGFDQTTKISKLSSNNSPLKSQSLYLSAILSNVGANINLIPLTENWFNLLGELTTPFKILIWGGPGQGKSTFCLQLASEISLKNKVVYISGEEDPNGKTFNDKVKRGVANDRQSEIQVVNRLPNIQEWSDLITPNGITDSIYKCIFYDSISVLNISPMYPAEVERQSVLKFFNSKLNHIFISHAQKDGKSYMGDSGWGHEVDTIIQVKNGVAIIEKNRFATASVGQIGATFKIF